MVGTIIVGTAMTKNYTLTNKKFAGIFLLNNDFNSEMAMHFKFTLKSSFVFNFQRKITFCCTTYLNFCPLKTFELYSAVLSCLHSVIFIGKMEIQVNVCVYDVYVCYNNFISRFPLCCINLS